MCAALLLVLAKLDGFLDETRPLSFRRIPWIKLRCCLTVLILRLHGLVHRLLRARLFLRILGKTWSLILILIVLLYMIQFLLLNALFQHLLDLYSLCLYKADLVLHVFKLCFVFETLKRQIPRSQVYAYTPCVVVEWSFVFSVDVVLPYLTVILIVVVSDDGQVKLKCV